MRLRLDLSYDGAGFRGWAAQPGLRTVQETVETSIATVLRLEERPSLTCAGRTDAGVHARGQVAHVDLDDTVQPDQLARRLRRILPDDVVVHAVTAAPDGFDARFAAVERRYAYRLQDQPGRLDPLARAHVVAWPKPLDVEAMNAAGVLLTGEHDFAAFCRRREGATTIRTLLELTTTRSPGDGLLVTTVRADAFCHSMVRALMGALVAVGGGRYEPSWARDVLRTGERDPRVKVMPAHGLVLEEVVYPSDDRLAARAHEARRRRDEPTEGP
ncbi:tRNA pseudouridine(38-40) synthase TruA [Aeromicrobium sp. Leaf245]|uniref:tRNA pseudouridine(38-40) synthase TruA n=1 Tax=Aeromicrobium sp. Leaf245 TaxID=1736306 RepID=UPI0007006396|nr:tRNA pseudouridine(38-40) synthase TruA [Aeromicrobium sp. Leaf245]KQO40043.1 pseudouridine synthase [Aeromicrobium sp. Leaf245]